ncbi:MAG: AtpZ/AtpI family protein [Balneolaceae bacterium]
MLKDPNLKKYAEYLSLGTEIALSVSVPILVGYWIDQMFEFSPVFTLIGVLLGIVLIILIFMRLIRKTGKSE